MDVSDTHANCALELQVEYHTETLIKENAIRSLCMLIAGFTDMLSSCEVDVLGFETHTHKGMLGDVSTNLQQRLTEQRLF